MSGPGKPPDQDEEDEVGYYEFWGGPREVTSGPGAGVLVCDSENEETSGSESETDSNESETEGETVEETCSSDCDLQSSCSSDCDSSMIGDSECSSSDKPVRINVPDECEPLVELMERKLHIRCGENNGLLVPPVRIRRYSGGANRPKPKRRLTPFQLAKVCNSAMLPPEEPENMGDPDLDQYNAEVYRKLVRMYTHRQRKFDKMAIMAAELNWSSAVSEEGRLYPSEALSVSGLESLKDAHLKRYKVKKTRDAIDKDQIQTMHESIRQSVAYEIFEHLQLPAPKLGESHQVGSLTRIDKHHNQYFSIFRQSKANRGTLCDHVCLRSNGKQTIS